jgi:hypothetical protein
MGALTVDHIAKHIAKALVYTMGGRRRDWLALIGPVVMLPAGSLGHTNWEARPLASFGSDLGAILAAEALVRERYPYVDA